MTQFYKWASVLLLRSASHHAPQFWQHYYCLVPLYPSPQLGHLPSPLGLLGRVPAWFCQVFTAWCETTSVSWCLTSMHLSVSWSYISVLHPPVRRAPHPPYSSPAKRTCCWWLNHMIIVIHGYLVYDVNTCKRKKESKYIYIHDQRRCHMQCGKGIAYCYRYVNAPWNCAVQQPRCSPPHVLTTQPKDSAFS